MTNYKIDFSKNFDDIFSSVENNILSAEPEEEEPRESMRVPIDKKLLLTITEAAAYTNIGMHRINNLLRNPECQFVLYVGNKKLVKRKLFEEYLFSISEIA